VRLRLVLVGAVALLAQVTLLRELSVAFYGRELIVVLGLGVWLVGGGTGAAWPYKAMSSHGTNSREAPSRLDTLFLTAAFVLPASLVLCRGLHRLLGGVPGAYLQLPRQLGGLVLVLLPMGWVAGRLFRVAADAHIRRGGTAAHAYAWESVGSLAGGGVATWLLVLGWSNLQATLLTAVLATATALLSTTTARGPKVFRGGAAPSAVMLAVLLAAGAFSSRLDQWLTRLDHPALLATRDTPYGRLTLDRRGGQLAVFMDNALSWESQGTATEEFALLAGLQVDAPRDFLVLGGGAEGLVEQLLKFRPRRVDLVELDARALQLLRKVLPAEATLALDDPRVRVIFGDPRREMERLGRYDLILVGMPQPESGPANRFYTKEFHRECRRHLRERGVLALRLAAAENLWTPLLTWRNASVVKALKEVFPEVTVLPGTVSVVLAGAMPLPGPDLLARRFRREGITARLVGSPYLHYLYENDRRQAIEGLLAESPAPVNTDRRPIGYLSSLMLWLARFDPSMALHPVQGGRAQALLVALVGVLIAAPLLLLARSPRAQFRRIALAATAGLLAMVMEGLVILAYQSARGVLFQDLGLLLGLFMLGLAAGAMMGDARDAGSDFAIRGRRLLMGASAVAAITALLLQFNLAGSLVLSVLLLMAAGFSTGALFAVASGADRSDMVSRVGSLYGADLAGGCVGALATSLVLAPLLGLPFTALLFALLGLGLAISMRSGRPS